MFAISSEIILLSTDTMVFPAKRGVVVKLITLYRAMRLKIVTLIISQIISLTKAER